MDQLDPLHFGPSLPPVSVWQRRAVRARFILLGCYIVLTVAWYYVFLSRSNPLDLSFRNGDGSHFILGSYLVGTVILFGGQLLLLLGAPQLHWPRPRRRRSIFVSLAAGSAIATLLSAGIFLAGESLYRLIDDPGSLQVHLSVPDTQPTSKPAYSGPEIPWGAIGVATAAWTFWLLIFALVGSGQWTKRFRWMYRVLIGGTLIELLITIPIDAQVRRRTNCYCGEGTFLSLVIGLTAIVWTFGPGVVILFVIRRNQLLARNGHCLQCGYDLHGLDSARCPECGEPFKRLPIT